MSITVPLWLVATVLWLGVCAWALSKDPGPYGLGGISHLLVAASATVLYLLFWVFTLALS